MGVVQEEYTVPAGEVTIQLKNVEGYHGVEMEGTDLEIDGDGEQTVTLEAVRIYHSRASK